MRDTGRDQHQTGKAHNQVTAKSNEQLPVAILTTTADEYELPTDFDATTIDPATVLFGTSDALASGGGSSASPATQFIDDWHELDEVTRDGDDDARVLVGVPGSGITTSDTEACLTGTYSPDGVTTYTFYGCDRIAVR